MEKKLIVESGGVLHMPPKTEDTKTGKWTASVWKLDKKNLNGRIYSTELAKRIVKESPTTLAYDGHDAAYATGAEYSIAKAVCSNPRIESGELRVDIDFVDETYERLLTALMHKGVPIGVSSIGWGEQDDDGNILPETYELVRFLDFVTSPAGEVYAKMEKRKPAKGSLDDGGGPMGEPPADSLVRERRAKVAKMLAQKIVSGGKS